ncbi:MAG: DUF308 domain-containing protein [Clostridiales bacterium]|nr:DUF308 domain-containing protein [Clostridiales bacterium]
MAKNKKNKRSIDTYSAGTVVVDFVMLILGFVFLINTIMGKGDQVAAIFVRAIGGILIAVGLLSIITFFIKKEKELFDWIVMIFGVAIGVFGIVVVIRPEPVINILNWIMGLIIIVYAIVVIFTAIGILRPAGANYWGFSTIFGLVTLALGFFIIFFNLATKAMMIIIGITLVLGAIGGIANALLASQAKKAARKVIKAAGLDPVDETDAKEQEIKNDDLSSGGDDVTKF